MTGACDWILAGSDTALAAKVVHVWRVPMEATEAAVTQLRSFLSPDESGRAGRFHFEVHRRRFIIARGCLRAILSRYIGIPAADICFEYGSYGKPRLAPLDRAAHSLEFNLAHSGDFALYAVTRLGEVGVDLELIQPDVARDEIARYFFSRAEIAVFRGLHEHARPQAFFDCWTRKEAFIKAKGMGLSLPLDQFDVTLAPAEPAALLSTRWDEAEAGRWSLRAIEVAPGYAGAVAIQTHEWDLHCWTAEAGALLPAPSSPPRRGP
jgi:4'-phosphopantetheinyl transferase